MDSGVSQPTPAKWGWWIVIGLNILLVLNGIFLYFLSATPDVFLQDTGVPREEVEEVFPTVVDHVISEGQTLSVLLAGLGLVSLVVSLGGRRFGSRPAWNSTWMLTATLAAIGMGMVVRDRLGLGAIYLVLAGTLVVGLVLARTGLESSSTEPSPVR